MRTTSTSELVSAPIRHATLPVELQQRIAGVYRHVGRFVSPTLEQFEIGFLRDARPEREILIWERITTAWHLWHDRHCPSADRQNYTPNKAIVQALILFSMGGVDPTCVLPATGRELRQCWNRVSC